MYRITCFDNANDDGNQGGDPNVTKTFTQDEVNKILADDKRKHQAKFTELESAYKDVLATKSLTEDERKKLETKLEDLQKTYRTREQTLEIEKKQVEEKLTAEVAALADRAKGWEQKYKNRLVSHALTAAAATHEAFNPSQIVALLTPMTQVIEETSADGKPTGELIPVIDLQDVDAKTGEPIITRHSPSDAVKRLKELKDQYGNLFKSNVVSGVGAGAATGGKASGGKVDLHKLSTEDYMRLRKEQPSALGL